jgi:hypothetical protein
MAQFSCGTNATFTPTASTTVLASGGVAMPTAGQIGKVKMFNWGGDGTSLVGYISRIARVTTAPTGAATNGLIGLASNPGAVALATYPLSYATTQPISVADTSLFKQNWNVQGGGGAIVLPIGGEWCFLGGALSTIYSQIAWGNVTGADANLSSYGMTWEE